MDKDELLKILQKRFEENRGRHTDIDWDHVYSRLNENSTLFSVLLKMEQSGGEPDVIGQEADKGRIIFCDCSAESPKERRSLCYDSEALESRKEHKPVGNVLDTAAEIGIELLDEEQYRNLQALEPFDQNTSSWIKTPDSIRKLGGAIFADYRYGTVFIYHNGAESYYSSRGFRGIIRI